VLRGLQIGGAAEKPFIGRKAERSLLGDKPNVLRIVPMGGEGRIWLKAEGRVDDAVPTMACGEILGRQGIGRLRKAAWGLVLMIIL
jgi:hypothetical protein